MALLILHRMNYTWKQQLSHKEHREQVEGPKNGVTMKYPAVRIMVFRLSIIAVSTPFRIINLFGIDDVTKAILISFESKMETFLHDDLFRLLNSGYQCSGKPQPSCAYPPATVYRITNGWFTLPFSLSFHRDMRNRILCLIIIQGYSVKVR